MNKITMRIASGPLPAARNVPGILILTALALFLAFPARSAAQQTMSQQSPVQTANGVSVTIAYYNKSIYFPNSDIEVKVTITNASGSVYRFRVADNRIFSLDFDIRSITNIQAPRSTKFTAQANSNQPVFFREISLDPGADYGFTENLGDYRAITDPGMYVVTATFYPELISNPGIPGNATGIQSNQLTLSVEPSLQGEAAVQAQINQSTGAILQQEALPPDQVVTYMLQARQHSDWNKFFLYLDVVSLLRSNPSRDRQYIHMSAVDQQAYVKQFKQMLQQQTVEGDISVIPSDFQILQTSYTPEQGTVKVLELFRETNFTQKREYTYQLKLENGIWMITGYELQKLGTQ